MTERVLGNTHAWKLHVPGGGAAAIEVQEDGTIIVPAATILDFAGAGVTVVPIGLNTARIDIPGGGVPPLNTQLFFDNVVTDILVGTNVEGCIVVDASISKANGESTCYRFMFGVSATGTTMDCPKADSDLPIQDITPQSAFVAGNIFLRLVGSGGGIQSGIAYRVSSIPRLL